MIDYIIGEPTAIYDTAIALECGGIGYYINVSTNTIQHLEKGEQKIFIRMVVREDGITLYGFASLKEREVFDKLITVQKVGPKAAMSLLCVFSADEIIMAIIMQDHKALTKASGVGNKMAEQIVVALKGRFSQNDLGSEDTEYVGDVFALEDSAMQKRNEAVFALTSLGFDPTQANRALGDVNIEENSLEEIIKAALKALAN